ncbi:sulfatase [Thermogutta sp.]|uniref:sulfatase n=1 Tax=Thermogutta sp. TaxID=1962930 RepID=UPI003C79971A
MSHRNPIIAAGRAFVFAAVGAIVTTVWGGVRLVQGGESTIREGSHPNFIFILADDLGYTDLGCYGSRYYETPNIDRMAAEGMRFTDGYTAGPNCQPTRAALISGQYGPRTGVYTVGSIERFPWRTRPLRPVDNVEKLPLDKVTLAQALKGAGYVTGLFGKWHLGEDPEHHPSARGFDEAITSAGRHFNFVTNPRVSYPEGTYLADFLTDKAVDFIRRHSQEPFFLCVHHFGVHSPYQAKAELIKHFERKPPVDGHSNPVYAAMIASVDESVGRILAALAELGLDKNTLVIFTSDNGGVGGYERLGIMGGSITDNAPLRGGKGMLYEGGIRVPFIFRWPGHIPAGAECRVPIHSVDIYPTLLELAGAKPPADYVLDGVSLVPLLRQGDKAQFPERPLFWHFPGYLGAGQGTWRTTPVGAIRLGDWKLLEFFEDGHLELYNLREDIGEEKNLASQNPQKAAELHELLKKWRAEIHAPMPTPHTPEPAGKAQQSENRPRRAQRRAQQSSP